MAQLVFTLECHLSHWATNLAAIRTRASKTEGLNPYALALHATQPMPSTVPYKLGDHHHTTVLGRTCNALDQSRRVQYYLNPFSTRTRNTLIS